MILRRIARPMLAAVFVSGGIETLRNPQPRVETAEPAVDKATDQVLDKLPDQALDKVPDKVLERVPTDTESLVKINAAAQIGAGIALALGKFPRLSALVLAGSVVPTTFTSHRYWEKEDSGERAQQQVQFFKNVSLLGGLLLAAVDTHGKPSAAWRAKHAAKVAANSARGTASSARDTVSSVLPG
ncbi:DoxX family membrane protein [Actinophytocola glycyrrhizae]|uniref:DoxX family membrane protein n=1 Tax=Actinophytocola glycyrrhizae TaxID=2044873 RepID=A0ABV9S1F7_9PSEU